MQPSDFPLSWPEGRERTAPGSRVAGRFKVDFRAAYDALVAEAERLHDAEGWDVIVSTCVPLSDEGLPVVAIGSRRIADPGVAVYLHRGGRPYALACDTYLDVHHNMRALSVTIQALRTIERHGTAALMAQSMVGFCREIGGRDAPEVRMLSAGVAG